MRNKEIYKKAGTFLITQKSKKKTFLLQWKLPKSTSQNPSNLKISKSTTKTTPSQLPSPNSSTTKARVS
jgi:hypothetical protein